VSELRETHPRSKIADVRGGNNKPKQIIVNASFCDEIEGSGKCNYDVPSVHELQTPYPLKHVLMCVFYHKTALNQKNRYKQINIKNIYMYIYISV